MIVAFHVGTRILQGKASPHTRKRLHIRRVIRANGFVGGVQHRRAIRVELHQTNGEQLHDLSRIVLVWVRHLFVVVGKDKALRFAVAKRQTLGCEWVPRDFAQNIAVVAKGMANEYIVCVMLYIGGGEREF